MGKDLEQKYEEFIVARCKEVITSCTNSGQLAVALSYCYMFKNQCIFFDRIKGAIDFMYLIKCNEFNSVGDEDVTG